jgi:hypothetical protein
MKLAGLIKCFAHQLTHKYPSVVRTRKVWGVRTQLYRTRGSLGVRELQPCIFTIVLGNEVSVFFKGTCVKFRYWRTVADLKNVDAA